MLSHMLWKQRLYAIQPSDQSRRCWMRQSAVLAIWVQAYASNGTEVESTARVQFSTCSWAWPTVWVLS